MDFAELQPARRISWRAQPVRDCITHSVAAPGSMEQLRMILSASSAKDSTSVPFSPENVGSRGGCMQYSRGASGFGVLDDTGDKTFRERGGRCPGESCRCRRNTVRCHDVGCKGISGYSCGRCRRGEIQQGKAKGGLVHRGALPRFLLASARM